MSSKWVSEDRVSDGNTRILISTYISLVAHLEHICLFTDFTEAFCVCLGFLWLDVKIDKKKPSLSSSYPTTKFPTVLRYFHCYEPWGEQQLYSWRVSSVLLGRSWALPGTSGHFFFRAIPRSYEWAMMILWTRNTLKSAEIPIVSSVKMVNFTWPAEQVFIKVTIALAMCLGEDNVLIEANQSNAVLFEAQTNYQSLMKVTNNQLPMRESLLRHKHIQIA